MMTRSHLLFFSLVVGLTACSDDSGSQHDSDTSTDTGTGILDVNSDAEPDVDPDAEPDVDPDAEPDVDPDAEPDAEPDANTDTADDSGEDVSDVEVDTDAGDTEDTSCDEGFELIESSCVDIDECLGDPCDTNATCTNTDGGFECACDEGLVGDGFVCGEDVCLAYETVSFSRAAEEDVEDCITDSVCLRRDATRSFYNSVTDESAIGAGCDAVGPTGTEWAPGACLGNDDEFTTFALAVGCSPRSAVGAPLCLHVLAEDLFIDITLSEWGGGGSGGAFAYERTLVAGGPCAPGAVCSFDGTLTCECMEGLSGDGLDACDDVDECSGEVDPCAEGICTNTFGGFECVCDDGFAYDSELESCEDIDECADSPCDENAICTNSTGAFECTCEDGFTGDGFTCIEDVGCDPECGVNELCVDEDGTAVCVCPVGYVVVEDVCTQFDECAATESFDFDYVAGDDPDCITDSVCIGRPASGGPIWNTLVDVLPRDGCDTVWPSGTEWAAGDCAAATEFSTFIAAVDCSPPGALDASLCLHVIAEDEYHDVTLTAWRGGGTGGFAYTRRRAGVGCDVNAECVDTPGSFECECIEGYEGDGLTCDLIPG